MGIICYYIVSGAPACARHYIVHTYSGCGSLFCIEFHKQLAARLVVFFLFFIQLAVQFGQVVICFFQLFGQLVFLVQIAFHFCVDEVQHLGQLCDRQAVGITAYLPVLLQYGNLLGDHSDLIAHLFYVIAHYIYAVFQLFCARRKYLCCQVVVLKRSRFHYHAISSPQVQALAVHIAGYITEDHFILALA